VDLKNVLGDRDQINRKSIQYKCFHLYEVLNRKNQPEVMTKEKETFWGDEYFLYLDVRLDYMSEPTFPTDKTVCLTSEYFVVYKIHKNRKPT
jgi:hypothetical protein